MKNVTRGIETRGYEQTENIMKFGSVYNSIHVL